MEFQLTKELVDQVMFGMENQDSEFLLDLRDQKVIRIDELHEDGEDDQERYIPLPLWRSVDGYNLMEKFVASLHNPIYREILRRILASGKGVFRQFKDALKEKKEIEQLWYYFKEREMRSRVVEWYNILRESWGLSRIGDPEGEETESLVLSDFTLTLVDSNAQVGISVETSGVQAAPSNRIEDIVGHFDRLGFGECYLDVPEDVTDYLYRRRLRLLGGPSDESSRILAMFTPLNDLAGFLWAAVENLGDGRLVSTIVQIYVLPEFRGLGLAHELFTHYCRDAYEDKVELLLFELHGSSEFLSAMIEREGARRMSQMYEINITRWYRENVEIV